MKTLSTIVFSFVLLLGTVFFPGVAHAGQFLIHNSTNHPINCHADGYPERLAVSPNETFTLARESSISKIDWVECEGYTVGKLNVTSSSPDRYLSFNGQAKQTLSVLLYPYLPTTPDGNFQPMVERIVNEFQAKNPDILLNAVLTLNGDYDTYTYENLPILLGKDGFDVVELDTFMFNYLVEHHLIVPTPKGISTSEFWPVGLSASTYNGTLYGIPSWLCSYFLFARDQKIWTIDSVEKLIDYFVVPPSRWPNLIADFNSFWNLISFYLDGYADLYGLDQVPNALIKPIDSAVINNLVKMTGECRVGPNNNCINKYYNTNPSMSVQDFAQGTGDSLIGFSEQSFSILTSNPKSSLFFATAAPYGSQLFPLLFTDSFVFNSSTCRDTNSKCQVASVQFMKYMNSLETKLWITFSKDLPNGTPPRRSLPAIQAFYQHPDVRNDELYPQFEKILQNKNANFPNSISPEKQYSMYFDICRAFNEAEPDYPRCDLQRTRERVFRRAKDF
ncbi:MAG TPA: hypothetical protein V6D11_30285 [Waterburya sp.]|jgi:thiamine pyridinylase